MCGGVKVRKNQVQEQGLDEPPESLPYMHWQGLHEFHGGLSQSESSRSTSFNAHLVRVSVAEKEMLDWIQ